MKEDSKIMCLSDRGMIAFANEFVSLGEKKGLGPLALKLVDRMRDGGLDRVETCLPEDMHGKVLEDCRDYVGYVWTNDYGNTANKRSISRGMGVEVMDLSWNPVAEAWLLHTVLEYLTHDPQRVCVVLDMWCLDMVVWDHEDIYSYHKEGIEEGYLLLPVETVHEQFQSCLYYGAGMSYGCLITLPEELTREDIMRADGPLSAETASLLAERADAVYIGAYDGLGYMVGWFKKEQEKPEDVSHNIYE